MTTLKTRLSVLTAFVGAMLLFTAVNAEVKPKLPMQTPPAEEPKETIKPKPLSDAVTKGLAYLVKQQHADSGWGQGGGWRTVEGGGRIEGREVKDPPDVGNTCIATLALIRAGNTPKEGLYTKEVTKAVEFICGHVAKSDDKSLLVTNIKGTQLQTKIGPYVDTFLTSIVLAELKDKMADEKSEAILMAALTKTISKIEKNLQADGTFAGNHGWASVLSQGLAGKGLSRAAQNGVKVDGKALDRIKDQVTMNFGKPVGGSGGFGGGGGFGGALGVGGGGFGGLGYMAPARGDIRPGSGMTGASTGADAGVPLYSRGQGLTNAGDVAGAMRRDRRL